MRAAVAIALVGLVVGCTGGSAGPAAGPSPLSFQQLAARPLKFPTVDMEQFCPTSQVTLVGGTAPRVGKPVGFGFGMRADGSPWPSGGYAFNKAVWDSSALPWRLNVLVRGARLDGQGSLYFAGNGISNPEPSRVTVLDSDGSRVLFYPQLRLPVDSNAAFYLYPTTAGCFAMQADSDNFSEVVVFKAI